MSPLQVIVSLLAVVAVPPSSRLYDGERPASVAEPVTFALCEQSPAPCPLRLMAA
jgi:hypothetical protein